MRSRETDEVFKILVSELAHTVMPSIVMFLTLAVTGFFAYEHIGNIDILLAVVIGSLASGCKILVMLAHQRFNATKQATVEDAARWERIHGLHTFVIASSVGWLASLMFLDRDLSIQILATTLVFGYCAGVSNRISVRPYIAATAITVAALPTIICAALNRDSAHWILTMVFAIFLLAAMQSVWHMYHLSARQIRLRLEMERQARHDPLTGLRNRTGLSEAFDMSTRQEGTLTGLHCFDLDGFKAVNDRFGHAVGDELLAGIGARLQELQGPAHIPVRLGGDEFVVLQTAITNPEEVEALAAKIVHSLSLPYALSGKPITVGISLGYTIALSETADLNSMIRLADAASYRAKRRGGGIDHEIPETLELHLVSSAA